MPDKTYSLKFTMSDGNVKEVGFTVPQGEEGAPGKSAYEYAKEGGYKGTETEFAAKMVEEYPDTLPNPHALTINGKSYDGSQPVSMNIEGGSSGGVSSWSDLTDKPFHRETVMIDPTFDGDPTGRECIEIPGVGNIVKVSPEYVPASDMIGATMTYFFKGVEYHLPLTAENAVDATYVLGVPGAVILNGTDMNVVSFPAETTATGVTVPAGTWFGYSPGLFYVKSLSCLKPIEGETVEKIDVSCLPDGYPYAENVIVDPTFNGDITGREIVQIEEGGYLVKMSPQYVSVSDLVGATATISSAGEEQVMPFTEELVIDMTPVFGVSGAAVMLGESAPLIVSIPSDATAMGITLTAGTWSTYVPGSEFFVKSLSCLVSGEQEVVHRLDPKYLPDGYPSVEAVAVKPIFNGDTTGFETVLLEDKVSYAVKVTAETYSTSDLVGATMQVDNNGVEKSVVLTIDDVVDPAFVWGVSGAAVFVENLLGVISVTDHLVFGNVQLSAGTWFIYMPGESYVKALSCITSFVREKVHELDKKFLPEDAWKKIAAPYVLDLTGIGWIGQNNTAYGTNLDENQYNAVLLAAKRGLLRVKANLMVKSNKNFYYPSEPVEPYDESLYGITIAPTIYIDSNNLIEMTAVISHSVLHITIQTPDQSSNCTAILKEISYV